MTPFVLLGTPRKKNSKTPAHGAFRLSARLRASQLRRSAGDSSQAKRNIQLWKAREGKRARGEVGRAADNRRKSGSSYPPNTKRRSKQIDRRFNTPRLNRGAESVNA
ncbi:hypothetical protein CHARACLAT_015212 [Characodon lateralis]|uniref:Uncharacterized protein n=1 Tax=Characodon lateralis TaxID=208331 RepID=A0ABU7EKI3_9TELE|nr:hypothetical protein [Characodon lateralis]